MDPVFFALVETIVAGAKVATSELTSSGVKDAYQHLKTTLMDRYGLMSVQLLEEAPSESAYQELLREELNRHPAIAHDNAVLEKASTVRDALSKETSETLTTPKSDTSNISKHQSASGTPDISDQMLEMQREIARLTIELQAALELGERQKSQIQALNTSTTELRDSLASCPFANCFRIFKLADLNESRAQKHKLYTSRVNCAAF
jgi:small-conductance mechanosensitive channel